MSEKSKDSMCALFQLWQGPKEKHLIKSIVCKPSFTNWWLWKKQAKTYGSWSFPFAPFIMVPSTLLREAQVFWSGFWFSKVVPCYTAFSNAKFSTFRRSERIRSLKLGYWVLGAIWDDGIKVITCLTSEWHCIARETRNCEKPHSTHRRRLSLSLKTIPWLTWPSN